MALAAAINLPKASLLISSPAGAWLTTSSNDLVLGAPFTFKVELDFCSPVEEVVDCVILVEPSSLGVEVGISVVGVDSVVVGATCVPEVSLFWIFWPLSCCICSCWAFSSCLCWYSTVSVLTRWPCSLITNLPFLLRTAIGLLSTSNGRVKSTSSALEKNLVSLRFCLFPLTSRVNVPSSLS